MVWDCLPYGWRGAEPGGGWDFFISYTQADRRWAEWIAWVLEEQGRYHVLVQAWDFVPGSNWIRKMQDGTRDAARTIAVLSDAYLTSEYGGAEWQAAWASDPTGANRKLLAVRIADCERPGLLAGVAGVDMFGVDAAAARARLLEMAVAAIVGRAKPATAPVFPGAGRAVPDEPRFPGGLPRIWGRVPPQNPNFTGRSEDLGKLAHELAADARVIVHSIHGMGGIGKTQLSIEYVHARACDYDLVWWIAADEPAAIPDQFTDLAAQLGLDPAAEPDALQIQVHDRLRTIPGWMLIFDNADTTSDIQPWLPRGPLPAGSHGHVIITTRRGGYAALGQVMDLNVIDLADAVQLLRSRVPGLNQEVGEQIAEELGQLPLALEQAAAYLDISQMPGQQYLELLRIRTDELYQRGQIASRQDVTIATLWDLSLERIASQNHAALQLLSVCAYLAPEPIPLDLFTTHPDLLPEPLSTAAADPLAFADTVTVLADYSLAKRTEAGLQSHPLIQNTMRLRYSHPSSSRRPLTQAVLILDHEAGPTPEQAAQSPISVLGLALALLHADVPDEIMGVPAAWPRWAVLLPHVLTATSHLDHPAGQPGRAVMDDASRLLDGAGTYLLVHARSADARPLLERAVAIDEATYGPGHPAVAIRLNNLAQILQDLGQPEQARPLQERALAIDEATYGPDHAAPLPT